ncbi:hypothetical protein GUJ93_ZPchr0015g6776 [Zizania palustris]|uniref:Uncharacterized protein n=1 Tax=Zizania palustris TaxID=103762 RepID=A0A8J5TGD7_ZIZPA|nr:hypothetical protein GUJ93_ZPchr0015g6776 [Zizania palustris]
MPLASVPVRLPRGSPPGSAVLGAQPRPLASWSVASTPTLGAQSACAPLPQPTTSQWRRFLSLVPLFKPPRNSRIHFPQISPTETLVIAKQ